MIKTSSILKFSDNSEMVVESLKEGLQIGDATVPYTDIPDLIEILLTYTTKVPTRPRKRTQFRKLHDAIPMNAALRWKGNVDRFGFETHPGLICRVMRFKAGLIYKRGEILRKCLEDTPLSHRQIACTLSDMFHRKGCFQLVKEA